MLTTRSTHCTTFVAALACALLAIAAPVSAAPPPADMHASFAQAAAKEQQKQDLRSPDARDAALGARRQELNRADAGGSYTPGSNALNTTATPPSPGPPTWPVNPEPIQPAPVVKATDTSGLDWTTIALGFGGGLLLLGGIAGIVLHSRRVTRGHIAA